MARHSLLITSRAQPCVYNPSPSDTRAMMQLGDIAMESAKKFSIHPSCAEEWYRKSAKGDPPQPDALFQVARIRHEVC